MKVLALVLFASMATFAVAPAKTLDVPDQGMHLDVPDSWAPKTAQASAAFAAINDRNTSALTLFVEPNLSALGLDEPDFVAGLKGNITNNLTGKGLTPNITKDGPITVNGVPFYQLEASAELPSGHTTYLQVYVAATADHVYTLSMESVDPNSGAELEGIANSLAFSEAPKMPDPSRPKDRLERWERRIELAAMIGALPAIAVIGAIVYFVRKRREEE
jgi:hypothetical protein